jgi:hypothetical protein
MDINADRYRRLDAAGAQELIDLGYTLAVVIVKSYGDKQEGELISVHKTREAAQRKANYTDHWAVRELSDYL